MSERPTVYEQVFGMAAPDVGTEFASVSQERVVDGLWSRPGLAHRDRRLLTLAVLYGATSFVLYRRFTTLQRNWKTLPATLDQLRKDRECLETSLT